MSAERVKDLMIPLGEYAVVSAEATLKQALQALRAATAKIHQEDRQPPRAVLAADEQGNVIGQLGHLDFLKALEPKYSLFGDLSVLARADLSSEFINSMVNDYHILEASLPNLCRRAAVVKVKDIMHPVSESLDEDLSLVAAIHRFVMWQTKRTLVTRRGKVVGVLRLADVFAEVERIMLQE